MVIVVLSLCLFKRFSCPAFEFDPRLGTLYGVEGMPVLKRRISNNVFSESKDFT